MHTYLLFDRLEKHVDLVQPQYPAGAVRTQQSQTQEAAGILAVQAEDCGAEHPDTEHKQKYLLHKSLLFLLALLLFIERKHLALWASPFTCNSSKFRTGL